MVIGWNLLIEDVWGGGSGFNHSFLFLFEGAQQMSRIQNANQRRAQLEADLHRAQVREAIATGKPMPTSKPGVKPGIGDDQEVDEDGNPIPSDEETEDLECSWNAAVQKFGAVEANRRFPGLRARLVSAVNARHQQRQMQSRSGSRRRRR